MIILSKRLELKYTGRVQGVGFRYTAQRLASSAGLTGYVKNLPDGGVELVAEGEEEKLKELKNSLEIEFVSNIEKVFLEWSEGEDSFKGFRVSY